MTRDELITEAFRKIGVLGDYETASATQLSIGATNLNAIVLDFAADGMPIWKMTTVSPTMASWTSAGKAVGDGATIDTSGRAVKLISAVRVNDSDQRIEMKIQTRDEFLKNANLEETGIPQYIYFQPGITNGTVKIWPLPNTEWADADHSIDMDFHVEYDSFAGGSSTPDFPAHWNLTLIYQLAHHLTPNYGIPIQERNLLERTAMNLKAEALSIGNEEGSVYIRPGR